MLKELQRQTPTWLSNENYVKHEGGVVLTKRRTIWMKMAGFTNHYCIITNCSAPRSKKYHFAYLAILINLGDEDLSGIGLDQAILSVLYAPTCYHDDYWTIADFNLTSPGFRREETR